MAALIGAGKKNIMKLIMFLFSLWVLATASIQTGQEVPDDNARFGQIITQTAAKLQESAARRPFKIKVMNDSLEKIAEALRLMAQTQRGGDKPRSFTPLRGDAGVPGFPLSASEGPREKILRLLREARAVYPENSFAILIQAVFYNAAGDTASANRFFEEYLLKSRTYSDFEKEFIKWNDYHTLRRLAYELLRVRGINFTGREKEIQVRTPYEQLMQYALHPAAKDRSLNLFFLVFILGGALCLMFGAASGMVFYRHLGFSLLVMYLAVWLAYACWIYDLAIGLPGGLNRNGTTLFFFFTGILISLSELISSWREMHRPLAPGFKRCPHCQEIIVTLAVECFRCKKPV